MKKKFIRGSLFMIGILTAAFAFSGCAGNKVSSLNEQPTTQLTASESAQPNQQETEKLSAQSVTKLSTDNWNYTKAETTAFTTSEFDEQLAADEKTEPFQDSGQNLSVVSYTQTEASDVQLIDAKVGWFSYPEITVQAGRPVRINFNVTAEDLNSCNNEIIIPSLNIKKPLNVGDNFVEFTPTKEGIIPYSCWMDMIRSNIIVTAASTTQQPPETSQTYQSAEQPSSTQTPQLPAAVTPSQQTEQSTSQEAEKNTVNDDTIQSFQNATISNDGDVTVIEAKVAAGGYSELVVEVGKPVRVNFKVDAADLNSCNDEIIMPEWSIRKKLSVGDNFVEFTPSRTGTFRYTCWMGMISSTVTVVEAGAGQVGALPLPEWANQQASCPMMSGNGGSGGGCGMMGGGFQRR